MNHLCIRSTRSGVCILLLAAASATALAVPKSKPGQYDYSVSVRMMGMSMPPVTFSHCVTQKDIDDGQAYVNSKKQADCSDPKVNWSGNEFTVDAICKNPDRTMTGKGHVTDRHVDDHGRGDGRQHADDPAADDHGTADRRLLELISTAYRAAPDRLQSMRFRIATSYSRPGRRECQ